VTAKTTTTKDQERRVPQRQAVDPTALGAVAVAVRVAAVPREPLAAAQTARVVGVVVHAVFKVLKTKPGLVVPYWR